MKPYKNLSSHHLGPLLLLARLFIYLGSLFALGALVMFISSLSSPYGQVSAMGGAVLLPASLILIAISGIFAAIVAFEENYRISVSKK